MRSVTRWMSACAAAATLSIGAQQALAQELPSRPRGGPQEVDADLMRSLADHWERDGAPSVVVLMGVEEGGTIRYDKETNLSSDLISTIQSDLIGAVKSIVHISSSRLAEEGMLAALQRNSGGEIDAETMGLLRSTFPADLVVDVELRKGGMHAGKQFYKPLIEVRDSRREGAIIFTVPLTEIAPDAPLRRVREFSTAAVSEFAKAYLAVPPQHLALRWVQLSLVGAQRSVFGERDVREMRREIRRAEIEGVTIVEGTFEANNQLAAATLRIRFEGHVDDLIFDLEDVFFELGYALAIMKADAARLAGFVVKDEVPDWFAIVNGSPAEQAELVRQVQHVLKQDGKPSVGILVGAGIDEQLGAFEDPDWDGAEAVTFDDEQLETQLLDRFTRLGFRVVHGQAVRDSLAREGDIAERFENREGLMEAMQDALQVDIVVIVDREGRPGRARYTIEMVDRRSAEFIGGVTIPSAATSAIQNPKYRVFVEDPESVAEFVAGSLLHRWKQFMLVDPEDPNSTRDRLMSVAIHNVEDFDRVQAIIDAFESLRAAGSVSNIHMSAPVASFELAYTGSPDDVKTQMFTALSALDFATRFSPQGSGSIRIDLGTGLRAKEVAEKVAERGQQAVVQERVASLKEASLRARDSIGVVAAFWGETGGIGTVWTVGDNLLATNSHVAQNVVRAQEYARANGIEPMVEVLMGADYGRRLRVGRVWLHPEWLARQSFTTDVALIEVVAGDAGAPLEIATPDQLASIDQLDDIALLGFPADGVPQASNVEDVASFAAKLPVLQTYACTIASITDERLRTTTSLSNRLLCFTPASRGGSSGSPLIGPDGTVIGLNAGGSVAGHATGTSGEPILVGSGLGYGPTVDVLVALIEATQ